MGDHSEASFNQFSARQAGRVIADRHSNLRRLLFGKLKWLRGVERRKYIRKPPRRPKEQSKRRGLLMSSQLGGPLVRHADPARGPPLCSPAGFVLPNWHFSCTNYCIQSLIATTKFLFEAARLD
jgi:hypothetical protein